MYRSCLYISLLAIFCCLVIVDASTVCTGYPKTYNGKPCASTTRYWDGQKGACGCGTTDTNPFSWQWTKPTAAASAPIYGSGTWCGTGCGKCFKLTPTGIGASPEGTGAPALTPLVVKVTNLCPYGGNEAWCAYDINSFGYDAHFDLMDYNMDGLVSSMGWNNPEVTYEEVDCAANGYLDWGCQCTDYATTVPTTPTTPTTTPTTPTTPTNAPTTKVTTTTTTTKTPTTTTTTTTKPHTTTTTTKKPHTTTTTTKKPHTTTTTTTTTHKPSHKGNKVPTTAPATSPAVPPAPVQEVTQAAPAPAPAAPSAPTQQQQQPQPQQPQPQPSTQSITIQTSSASNGWWFGLSVTPASSASTISSIEIMDTNGAVPAWSRMSYQGNDYWNLYSIAPGAQLQAPFSLRITTTAGQVAVANNVITSFSAVTINVGVAA